jgi:hypothetical protein
VRHPAPFLDVRRQPIVVAKRFERTYTAFRADWEAYVMDAGGTDQTNLTNDPRFDVEPAWSSDGT